MTDSRALPMRARRPAAESRRSGSPLRTVARYLSLVLVSLSAASAAIPAMAGGQAVETTSSPVLLVIQGRLDPDQLKTYEQYIAGTRPLMEKYSVSVEAVGGGLGIDETTAQWPVNAILKFPNAEAAEAFFSDPGYQSIRPLRDAAYQEMHLTLFQTRQARNLGPRVVAKVAFDLFSRGLSSGDWSAFLEMLTDDFEFCFPQGRWEGCHKGKDKAAEFFAYVSKVFPEGLEILEVKRVSGSGETVVFEFRDQGVLFGQPYLNRVAISLDVRGDKISGYREYFGRIAAPPSSGKE